MKQEEKKRCYRCKKMWPLDDFAKNRSKPDGRCSECRSCRSELLREYRKSDAGRVSLANSWRKRTYGISAYEYAERLAKQGGVCGICRMPETRKGNAGKTLNLSVDHCHSTGAVRGLLCSTCNSAIGLLRDRERLLASAILYLLDHKEAAND